MIATLHHPSYNLLIAILCYTLSGCAALKKPDTLDSVYETPTDYKYFPEYGWLPVLNIPHGSNELYKSKILPRYVAYDWHPRGDGSVWFSQRATLPKTEDEARRIIEQNFAALRKSNVEKTPEIIEKTGEIAEFALKAPLALAFLITLPITYPIYEITRSTPTGAPASVEAADGKPETRRETASAASGSHASASPLGRIEVRVADRAGRPIEDAEILLIYSPIRFTAYADEVFHRSYPVEKIDDDYGVSIELASVLVHYLGIEGAPRGKATGVNGTLSIELRSGMKEFAQLPRMVHFLVTKPGYVPQSLTIPAGKLDTTHILPVILEQDNKSPIVMRREFNPWIVSRQLNLQVSYYLNKFNYDPGWKAQIPSPPLEFERFKEYTLAAKTFAPDYPIVQSAMFFLELENGNREEAKKYGRFIDNNIYAKAIYQMIWDDGSTVFKWY